MTYEPHKAYYVFMAFNELRKLGKAVTPPATPKGVYVAAATDGQGRGAVMIANISGKPWKVDLDFGGWRVLSAKAIDKDRTYADASAPAEIPADSVWLLTCGSRSDAEAVARLPFVDLSVGRRGSDPGGGVKVVGFRRIGDRLVPHGHAPAM